MTDGTPTRDHAEVFLELVRLLQELSEDDRHKVIAAICVLFNVFP